MSDQLVVGQTDVCGACGKSIIVCVGPHWEHTNEGAFDHLAMPKAAWDEIQSVRWRYITTPTPKRGPTSGCCNS